MIVVIYYVNVDPEPRQCKLRLRLSWILVLYFCYPKRIGTWKLDANSSQNKWSKV